MKPGEAEGVRPVRLFVSYSHENMTWSKRLFPVLKVKANVDTLQPWHDTELKAGDRWDKEIQTELEQMDIFSAWAGTGQMLVRRAIRDRSNVDIAATIEAGSSR